MSVGRSRKSSFRNSNRALGAFSRKFRVFFQCIFTQSVLGVYSMVCSLSSSHVFISWTNERSFDIQKCFDLDYNPGGLSGWWGRGVGIDKKVHGSLLGLLLSLRVIIIIYYRIIVLLLSYRCTFRNKNLLR